MEEEDASPPSSPPTPDLVDLDDDDEEEEKDIVAATEAAAAAIASFSQRKGAPKLEDRRAKHNRTSQKWSTEENQKLLLGQRALGSEPTRWVLISKLLLPGRSATALSNLWRSERYQSEIKKGEKWTYLGTAFPRRSSSSFRLLFANIGPRARRRVVNPPMIRRRTRRTRNQRQRPTS